MTSAFFDQNFQLYSCPSSDIAQGRLNALSWADSSKRFIYYGSSHIRQRWL